VQLDQEHASGNVPVLADKTHHGALIASLSTPFGERLGTEVHDVSYRAVRPPDIYCAPWRCSPSATRIRHLWASHTLTGIENGYRVVSCSQAR
jgi:hypothetical protein